MGNVVIDNRGRLFPVEFEKELPFKPKRCFVVSDVPQNMWRGGHAHYQTQQVIFCVRGQVLVELDDGADVSQKTLYPGESIFIDKMIWDSQQFVTGNDIILVICSTEYDKQDYILDYKKFQATLSHDS